MPDAYWFGSYAPDRTLLDLQFLHIYWYSVLVTLGIALAVLIARKQYIRNKGKEQDMLDLAFYVVLGGLLGARVWHVFIFQWSYYSQHLIEIPKIWEGGIAIQGALLGGLATAFFYCRKKKLDLIALADSGVVGIPLAQAIGRWGNFFNQELYGLPSKLPWAIYIEPQNRVSGFERFSHFHPTFLYESILDALLFVLLLKLSKKKLKPGVLAAWYFIGYSAIRFIVDFVRIDPMLMIGFLRASQVLSIMFIGAASYFLYAMKARRVAK